MNTINRFQETIDQFNADPKKHSLAELIAIVMKDRLIEIYIGDTFEDIKYEDSTQKYVAVLIGKVVAAYGECLILDCAYADQKSKNIKFGNIVCLNERSIRTITEVDGSGVLKDTFLSTRDHMIIKRMFDAQKK